MMHGLEDSMRPGRRSIFLGLLLCVLTPFESVAFTISSPPEHAVFKPGQPITLSVDLGTEIAVGRVRYYWYRLDEEPVVSQQAVPAVIGTATENPPFGGQATVPVDAVGMIRLLAVGEITSGRLAGREDFDEVVVYVEPTATLSRIEFEAEKPLRLNTLGKIMEIPAVGLFSDGVVRSIPGSTAGSSYRSSDEHVISVFPEGVLQVTGDGTASIMVANRGQQGVLDVVVKTDGEVNRSPIAQAGPDQVIKSGSKAILNGLHSADPDGDPLRYEWKQVRGNKVSLLDADTPKATFVAPKVSSKRLLRFRLQVTDMKGPDTVKGADSFPSFVNVWIEP
jgi:hypothetical protein